MYNGKTIIWSNSDDVITLTYEKGVGDDVITITSSKNEGKDRSLNVVVQTEDKSISKTCSITQLGLREEFVTIDSGNFCDVNDEFLVLKS